MLHEAHTAVSRPALLIVVADDILVIWVGVFSQVALDELSRLVLSKLEHDVDGVDIAHVDTDGMFRLLLYAFVEHELVGVVRRAGNFTCSVHS